MLVLQFFCSQTLSNETRLRSFEIFEALLGDQWQRIAGVNGTASEGQYIVAGLHPWSGHTFVVALGNDGCTDQSDQCPISECWTLEARMLKDIAPCVSNIMTQD